MVREAGRVSPFLMTGKKEEGLAMYRKKVVLIALPVLFAASVLTCLLLAVSATVCPAADSTEPGRATLDKLLKAVKDNDYDSFVADGTDAVKAAATKQMLQDVSGQFSPRLKKGYTLSYLGELKQQGCQVFLWKLAYSDGEDDTLAKLALKDGKVAGFWLQ